MKEVRELLREADPLQDKATWPVSERDFHRKAVLAAGSLDRDPSVRPRSRIAAFFTVGLLVIAASFLGSRERSLFVSDLRAAAVRFEVRLAEDKPAPGLREAKVQGSKRSVYLQKHVIATNSDIAAARVIEGNGPTQYAVGVEFNASGAEKMDAATKNQIGKPVAILLDGQVVVAPVLRDPIGASAVITGNFTKANAERIVNGIAVR